ncbi:MAG: Alkaline phosphatase precursor [Pseudomonadota bacterium]|jgi:alkaline phosphatase D|uniref:alkaline phosphatase D family protein n=1 Tax=Limnohabitans sp. TaxID=1907725 RepID=UPI0028A11A6E|nr:alkaline phosphatase D family protein [Limnohabitans sp.]
MNPLEHLATLTRKDPRSALTRRDWHRMALALALSPWLAPATQAQTLSSASGAAQGPRWQVDPFSLGVASGQPQPDSVVLWTRLHMAEADAPLKAQAINVVCEVFADAALRQPVRQWRVQTDAARAHSVHVVATGLQPGRPYWYRFVCGSASSPVGRARTSPGVNDAVDRLRIALASCQHYEQGYFAAHREMAQRDLDLVLFVGDYIYESSNPQYMLRQHLGGVPKSLDEYRDRHAQYKSDADLRACHAAHTWLMTWDDHEVVNDYANDLDRNFTDPQVFLRRRAAAYQAYFEHMPVRLGPDAAKPSQMRIHDRMAWGRLADLWTLDCRQYRDHHACPDPMRGGGRVVVGCDALADPSRSMLGTAQEQWFTEGLTRSTKRWKLVAQSTQMSSSGVNTPLGRSAFTDGWDGYPQARAKLLDTVAQAGLQNVVVLGGDVHMNVAAQLRVQPNDERSPVVASEIVTTSVTSRGLGEKLLAQIRDSNPDILHARSDERGYTLLDIKPEGMRAEFMTTPNPAQAQGVFKAQAQWLVRAGVAGLQKA